MRIRLISWYLLLLFMIVAGLKPDPARAADAGQGIYVINAVTANNNILSSIKSNSNIDGIVLQVAWNAIEPSENVFNWSSIDAVLKSAASAKKHVSLIVMPGYETPTWVYSDGAQQLQFVWDIASWGPKLCSVQTIPVPWDPVFLAKWQNLIGALGARYSSNPTIASVKVTGVSSKTGETLLPTDVNQALSSGSISCKSYNDLADWQNVGYTRLKVESAWNDIMQMFAQAFPDTRLEAMMVPGGFPAIDDNGNIFPGHLNQDMEAATDIIATGASEYPSQFALQNDGWSATWTWAVEDGYAGQIMTGVQENHPQGTQAAQAIQTALAAGMSYLELYPTDAAASATQAELAVAHQSLQ